MTTRAPKRHGGAPNVVLNWFAELKAKAPVKR